MELWVPSMQKEGIEHKLAPLDALIFTPARLLDYP